MALRPNKEVNRLPGFSTVVDVNGVTTPAVMAGHLVALDSAGLLTLANGGMPLATNAVLGVADTTSTAFAAGSKYVVTDDYAKNGLIGAYIGGGVLEVWDDSRGAVFAADCINAAINTPLYVDSAGKWTATAGGAATAGATILGYVLSAPTASTGVLKIKLVSF